MHAQVAAHFPFFFFLMNLITATQIYKFIKKCASKRMSSAKHQAALTKLHQRQRNFVHVFLGKPLARDDVDVYVLKDVKPPASTGQTKNIFFFLRFGLWRRRRTHAQHIVHTHSQQKIG